MLQTSLRAWCAVALAVLIVSPLASAQDGPEREASAIGQFLLSIQVKDGPPVANVPVAIKREGSPVIQVVAVTGEEGTPPLDARDRLYQEIENAFFGGDADPPATNLRLFHATFFSGRNAPSDKPRPDAFWQAMVNSVFEDEVGRTTGLDYRYPVEWDNVVPPPPSSGVRASRDSWGIRDAFFVLTDDPVFSCAIPPALDQGVGVICGGAELSDDVIHDLREAVPTHGYALDIVVDTSCDGGGVDDGRAAGTQAPSVVTGGYLFPVGTDEGPDSALSDREVDFFRPLLLQFPDDLKRRGTPPPPDCRRQGVDLFADHPSDIANHMADNPETVTTIFGSVGYNQDFKDVGLGFDVFVPNLIPAGPALGIRGGVLIYPQDRTTTTIDLGVLYHIPTSVGGALPHVSAGPRAYLQSVDSIDGSSLDVEVGVGATVGVTVPVGPVRVLGEVGADRAYGATLPLARIGAGVGLGGR